MIRIKTKTVKNSGCLSQFSGQQLKSGVNDRNHCSYSGQNSGHPMRSGRLVVWTRSLTVNAKCLFLNVSTGRRYYLNPEHILDILGHAFEWKVKGDFLEKKAHKTYLKSQRFGI